MLILTIVPIPLTGDTDSVNPSQRLAEIRSKIAVAERSVRDIEQQLTQAILDPNSNVDANVLRQSLYSARAYEGELRTAENFWNEIVENNKKAEDKTREQFKPA